MIDDSQPALLANTVDSPERAPVINLLQDLNAELNLVDHVNKEVNPVEEKETMKLQNYKVCLLTILKSHLGSDIITLPFDVWGREENLES